MKFLFLLFFVLITYSLSTYIQYISIGNTSPDYLRASTDIDYFYFSTYDYVTYNNVYLLLIDDDYSINDIKYCATYSYPSDDTIKECQFSFIPYDGSKSTYSGIVYYYKIQIPTLSNTSYIIIKYSGKNSLGSFRAKSYFAEKIYINPYDETELSPLANTDNYFFTDIR